MKHSIRTILTVCLLAICLVLMRPAHALSDEEEGPIHTLLNQVQFSGVLEPGQVIRVTVYTYLDGRERVLLYQNKQVTGESGLYSFSVPLPLIGSQYILLELGDEIREYAYLRYPERLVSDLMGYNLNIYEFLTERDLLKSEDFR